MDSVNRLPETVQLIIAIALIPIAIVILLRLRRGAVHFKDWLVALLLTAMPFILFWQATLRLGAFFSGDILLIFLPFHTAYANAVRTGFLPLWSPQLFAGFPLFAEGQMSALYPIHPILYGLLPIDLATNYDILIQLAWVRLGTFLFARTLRLQVPSAFLTAFVFGSGGFFIAHLQHMNILTTAAWLPWLLWTWEKRALETDPKRRHLWFALLVIFSCIQWLGGQPQFAFLTDLLLAMYVVVRWRPQQDATSHRYSFPRYVDLKQVIPLGIALLLGVALAAGQLLPTVELATMSTRAEGLDLLASTVYPLRPIHFLMLFNPFVLGNPYPSVSIELIGYIGFLPILLALGAPLVRRDRRVVFFLVVALTALYLGMGNQSLLYRALRHLPFFNYFRVPSRFLFWSSFAFAVLAGITFDDLLTRAPVSPHLARRQKVVLGVFAILIVIIVGLVPAIPPEVWLSVWTWLPWFFALVTAIVLLGAQRRLFTQVTFVTIILGFTVIDLALFASVYLKTYDATTQISDFYAPPRSLSVLRDLSPQDGRVLTSPQFYPSMSTLRESLYENSFMIYGIAGAAGWTPLVTQRATDYIAQMTPQMMNLLNVRYYLIPQTLPFDPETETKDLQNPFTLNLIEHRVPIPPTQVAAIQITSSLAQSVNLHTGEPVAQIELETQDGTGLTFPIRAGIETAEWAYERSDVRQAVQHAMPLIATTFPARSGIPIEAHNGHTYRAQFDVERNGELLVITNVLVHSLVPSGLFRVERFVLVTPEGKEISLPPLVGRDDQTLIYRSEDVAIFENQDVLRRAFLVHDVHVADDRTALTEMQREEFDPRQTLVLADGDTFRTGGAQRDDEYVLVDEYQPERVVLSVRANEDGYVLLADSWYPGWVARIDGVEAPIQRANLLFRAVRVNRGAHIIEFEYRPLSFYVGVIVSLIALAILIGIVVFKGQFPPLN